MRQEYLGKFLITVVGSIIGFLIAMAIWEGVFADFFEHPDLELQEIKPKYFEVGKEVTFSIYVVNEGEKTASDISALFSSLEGFTDGDTIVVAEVTKDILGHGERTNITFKLHTPDVELPSCSFELDVFCSDTGCGDSLEFTFIYHPERHLYEKII
jgi:hypothetical protein